MDRRHGRGRGARSRRWPLVGRRARERSLPRITAAARPNGRLRPLAAQSARTRRRREDEFLAETVMLEPRSVVLVGAVCASPSIVDRADPPGAEAEADCLSVGLTPVLEVRPAQAHQLGWSTRTAKQAAIRARPRRARRADPDP